MPILIFLYNQRRRKLVLGDLTLVVGVISVVRIRPYCLAQLRPCRIF